MGRRAGDRRRARPRIARRPARGRSGPLLRRLRPLARASRCGRSTWRACATLLERLAGTTGRLVYASSTGVYGRNDGGWVDEDSPTEPTHRVGPGLPRRRDARALVRRGTGRGSDHRPLLRAVRAWADLAQGRAGAERADRGRPAEVAEPDPRRRRGLRGRRRARSGRPRWRVSRQRRPAARAPRRITPRPPRGCTRRRRGSSPPSRGARRPAGRSRTSGSRTAGSRPNSAFRSRTPTSGRASQPQSRRSDSSRPRGDRTHQAADRCRAVPTLHDVLREAFGP